jgi:hypothetical protein
MWDWSQFVEGRGRVDGTQQCVMAAFAQKMFHAQSNRWNYQHVQDGAWLHHVQDGYHGARSSEAV